MTASDDTLCAQVFDRMVEAGDLGGDATLLAHAGSCMACFRVLGELRDAARLKEILRASPPAQPPVGDPLWDELASRVTAAVRSEATSVRGPRPAKGTTSRMRRRITGGVGVAFLAAAAALRAAIGELPTKQRMTVELRLYEDLPFRDIAEALGISEGAAKVNFHYAVRKLRGTFAPADGGGAQRGKIK